jgi:cytochrome c peroxidase
MAAARRPGSGSRAVGFPRLARARLVEMIATGGVVWAALSLLLAPPRARAQDRPAAAASGSADGDIDPRTLKSFAPLRASIDGPSGPATDDQVALGRMLFFDPRLSRDGRISCNTCHRLDQYGVDGLKTSVGYRGKRGKRNAPTVYHAAGYFQQFWDGRAPDVETQAQGPILAPGEMAMKSGRAVVRVLKAIDGYVGAFGRAFPGEPDPIRYENVGRAIGAFERRLLTPSRWDAYLAGDKQALSAEEKSGFRTFTSVGCMVCHQGEMLGGQTFQKLGAVEPWPNQGDQGRFDITKIPLDKMLFKVPTLRNVEKTAPYFHDGSAGTLEEAVRLMAKHQLGLELTDPETRSMVAWLKSLTGTLPADLIVMPELPAGPALSRARRMPPAR